MTSKWDGCMHIQMLMHLSVHSWTALKGKIIVIKAAPLMRGWMQLCSQR